MPRFYFDVNQNGSEARDNDGRDLPDRTEAQAHAAHVAGRQMNEPAPLVEDGGTVAVDARDGEGNHICTARLVLSDRTT